MLFKRAEQYANEYRAHEREEIRMKRLARHNGELYVPAQPKVYFVIRIRGCVCFSGVRGPCKIGVLPSCWVHDRSDCVQAGPG